MTDYNPFKGPRPKPTPRPDPICGFWTMGLGSRRAQAILYPHPLGFELWITDTKQDGFARTQVHRAAGGAEDDAKETRND